MLIKIFWLVFFFCGDWFRIPRYLVAWKTIHFKSQFTYRTNILSLKKYFEKVNKLVKFITVFNELWYN